MLKRHVGLRPKRSARILRRFLMFALDDTEKRVQLMSQTSYCYDGIASHPSGFAVMDMYAMGKSKDVKLKW